MTKEFVKGLLMTLAAVLVAAFNTTPIVWSIVIITLIGTAVIYTGKNAILFLKSDSKPGTLTLVNALSALFIAVGTGVIQAVASIAGTGIIDWSLLGKVVLSVTFTYLGSTFFAGKNTEK
jgi:hypothetical protein